MKLTYLIALPLAAALILGPVLTTGPTAAHAAGKAATAKATKPVAKPVAKLVAKPVAKPVTKPAPKQLKKPAPFTVVGTLTTVDATAGTVTVAVKAGARELVGKTVPVTVLSTAKIILDDLVVPLASLPVGAKVTVHGTDSASTLTASKVIAASVTPTPEPSPPPTA